jgi:hypothetical protein
LMQTSSAAVMFTPCSLDTNRLWLIHTQSTTLSGLELQYDQGWAVMSFTQYKYFSIWIIFFISIVIKLIQKRL